MEEIVKQAQAVSEIAAREGIPPLEMVKEFLSDQIKNAHLRRGIPVGRGVPR